MADLRNELQILESRRQQLVAVEARAQANFERAQQDMAAAKEKLSALGFSSVDEATAWLQEAGSEVQQQMVELDALLTKAGV